MKSSMSQIMILVWGNLEGKVEPQRNATQITLARGLMQPPESRKAKVLAAGRHGGVEQFPQSLVVIVLGQVKLWRSINSDTQ